MIVPASQLDHRMGLYYVGVGQLVDPNDVHRVTRQITVGYTVRVLSKHCYWFDKSHLLFNSSGLKVRSC